MYRMGMTRLQKGDYPGARAWLTQAQHKGSSEAGIVLDQLRDQLRP